MYKVATLIALIASAAFASDDSDRAPGPHGFMFAPDTMGLNIQRPEVQIKAPEFKAVEFTAAEWKLIQAQRPDDVVLPALINGLALGDEE